MFGVALVLLAVFGLLHESSQASRPELEAEWRAEYPAAAARWEARMQDFLAKGSYTFKDLSGSVTGVRDLTVAASGENRLLVRDQASFTHSRVGAADPDPTVASVLCETPEVAFGLGRTMNSTEYIINYHRPFEFDGESDFHYFWKQFARSATVYYGISLADRLESPSFVLESIESIDRDGARRVRVTYRYSGKYAAESGWVEMDPSRDWAICAVDVVMNNNKSKAESTLKVTIEYREFDGGAFWPRKIEVFLRVVAKPDIFEHRLIEYDDVKFGNVPAGMFKLSAYNLPDIPLSPAPPQSVFRLDNPLAWIALAAAVISFLLFRRLRHPTERSTQANKVVRS